jgi:hypothetical protein
LFHMSVLKPVAVEKQRVKKKATRRLVPRVAFVFSSCGCTHSRVTLDK